MIQPTRRGFLLGMLAAPVIVKASSLMAVKAVEPAPIVGLVKEGDQFYVAVSYVGNGLHRNDIEFKPLGFKPEFIYFKQGAGDESWSKL